MCNGYIVTFKEINILNFFRFNCNVVRIHIRYLSLMQIESIEERKSPQNQSSLDTQL